MGVVSPRIRRSAKHQGKNYQTIRRIGEAEFIAYAKVNPGKLNVASGGNAVGANVSIPAEVEGNGGSCRRTPKR
jgi:hypothetical protein